MEEFLKEDDDNEIDFMSTPPIRENSGLLRNLGVLDHIESLNRDIRNYRSLLVRGLDIFNRTSIDEIMDAMVCQIFDQFLPSFIAFLWKPIQTKEDITVKAYKNYKPVDINFHVDRITAFENFFMQYPKPINFELLAFQMDNEEAVKPYLDIHTEIAVPILGPFGLYGIILVGKKILEEGYSRDELYFLQQLMSFVSQAIKNHLHYEHSLRDVKTGLYNHGFFLTRLGEEIIRTHRNGYNSSIIVIDVDKFKSFNDTYGHLAGDKVLENIAQAIRAGVRADDIPSRFGGEEFTVLLPNTDKSTAWIIAERLRTSIADMTVPWEKPLPHVTISAGIYTFDRNVGADVSDIIRHADQALYTSKEHGRNCCTMWHPGIVDPGSAGDDLNESKTTIHDSILEML